MKYLNPKIFKRLEDKLNKLNALRPLPETALKKLKEFLRIEMAYNSNAIEGNSLTLKETFLVINEGITIKGKPLRDHLEARDQYQALKYLYDLVENGKHNTVSEHLIRSIHQLVMMDTDKEWAGVYRNANVIISGADYVPPDAIDVPRKMANLIKWLSSNRNNFNIVELASMIHHKIVYIHPFFDGNGRISRIIMNLLLMQYGFPLVIILKNDRKKYYKVLSNADRENYKPMVQFISQCVERSLDVYLKTLTPITGKKENFLILSELAKKTPYSAKYLNLLIRQYKLEAHKEKRNWLSSEEAVKRYIDSRERKRKLL